MSATYRDYKGAKNQWQKYIIERLRPVVLEQTKKYYLYAYEWEKKRLEKEAALMRGPEDPEPTINVQNIENGAVQIFREVMDSVANWDEKGKIKTIHSFAEATKAKLPKLRQALKAYVVSWQQMLNSVRMARPESQLPIIKIDLPRTNEDFLYPVYETVAEGFASRPWIFATTQISRYDRHREQRHIVNDSIRDALISITMTDDMIGAYLEELKDESTFAADAAKPVPEKPKTEAERIAEEDQELKEEAKEIKQAMAEEERAEGEEVKTKHAYGSEDERDERDEQSADEPDMGPPYEDEPAPGDESDPEPLDPELDDDF